MTSQPMPNGVALHAGDCLEVMAGMEAESVHAIVTDPPYGLSFMGKEWDHGVPGEEFWVEALRVAKPGAHLIAFGGTRTFHRLTCAIEDAGWEVRDCLSWVYGSGFPKSLDVSKAIDRRRDDSEQVYRVTAWIRSARDAAGLSNRDIDEAFGANGMGRHWTDVPPGGKQPAVPTLEQIPKLLDLLGVDPPEEVRHLLWDLNGRKGQPGENWARREKTGQYAGDMGGLGGERLGKAGSDRKDRPATTAAREWQGWGTALKPAWEPIILARKPLTGTVAANVLEHGTGAINVDGCRVGLEGRQEHWSRYQPSDRIGYSGGAGERCGGADNEAGRWPANLAHDGSEEVLALFPDSNGQAGAVTGEEPSAKTNGVLGPFNVRAPFESRSDSGSAARFFYTAKATKADRGSGNDHPTVKPNALMRWLVRMVTPPGGTVLDPFMGSGSTGKAARDEGFEFVGIDLDPHHLEIALARMAQGSFTFEDEE